MNEKEGCEGREAVLTVSVRTFQGLGQRGEAKHSSQTIHIVHLSLLLTEFLPRLLTGWASPHKTHKTSQDSRLSIAISQAALMHWVLR